MKKTKRLAVLMLVAVMLAASFVFPTAAQEYADVSGHWAKEAISRFSDEGIINGYDGNFSPDSEIIRGDAAIIISRIFNLAETEDNFFDDVSTSDYYVKSVNAVKNAEIMQGKSEKSFAPLENLTRQETAVILARSLKLNNAGSLAEEFTDSENIADWARESIYECAYNGVFGGYEDGSVKPKQNITRAEFVTVLDNAFTYIAGESVTENIFGRTLAKKTSTSFGNVKISGDIFAAGEKLSFADTAVSGKIIALNTKEITFSGNTFAESAEADGKSNLKIQTSDDSVVQKLIIGGNGSITVSGNVRDIEIESETKLILENAAVKTVVANKKSTVSVDGNSYIETATLNADGCILNGVGAVKAAYVNASGCTVTTSNTEVTTATGAFDTLVGTEKIGENSKATSPDNTQSVGGSSDWTETVVSTEIDKGSLGEDNKDKDEEKDIEVYLAIDDFILGNDIEDFILPPKKIKTTNKTSVAKTIVKEIGGMIKYSGSTDSNFYMSALDALAFAPQTIEYEKLPKCFKTVVESGKALPKFEQTDTDMEIKNTGGWLGEFDYTSMSGWLYSVNGKYPNVGMSDYILSDGDVIRLTFTLWGWGADVGGGYAAGGSGYANYYKVIDLTEMIKEYADNPTSTAYAQLCETAMKISEE